MRLIESGKLEELLRERRVQARERYGVFVRLPSSRCCRAKENHQWKFSARSLSAERL